MPTIALNAINKVETLSGELVIEVSIDSQSISSKASDILQVTKAITMIETTLASLLLIILPTLY